MIPRIEDKLEVSRLDYPKAISWLRSNGLTILYPMRVVNSIYFDNHKFQMLFDAQEGLTPRRKMRIRYYGNDRPASIESSVLEIKESAASGRSKSILSNLDITEALSMGIYTKAYGLCRPVVKITYVREYFKLNHWRITLDRNLTYENYGNQSLRRKAYDDSFVLEIKTSIDQDKDLLRNFFNFPRSKFSKYERAFMYLNSQ